VKRQKEEIESEKKNDRARSENIILTSGGANKKRNLAVNNQITH